MTPLVATAAGVQGAFVAGLVLGLGMGALGALLLTGSRGAGYRPPPAPRSAPPRTGSLTTPESAP